MKQRYLTLFCAMILIAFLFFYFSSTTIEGKITKIKRFDKRIKVQQEKLNSAKVLNEQLQQVAKVIQNSITDEDKYTPEESNRYVKKLADLADRYQIAVHSMTPKSISSVSRNYAEQLYTMELNCTFIQLGQFLSDLEAFDYILNVKTLDVRPLSGDRDTVYQDELVTHYKVTLELSTLKIVKEA